MILVTIGIIAVGFVMVFTLAILRGSADEQDHYEQIYQKYVDDEKKNGIHF